MINSVTIGVIGAGSWGTALSLHLAKNGHNIRLWDIDEALLANLQKNRVNKRYLPDFAFPTNITICNELSAVLAGIEHLLLVVPSEAFTDTLRAIKANKSNNFDIAWGTKGLAANGQFFHHEVEATFGSSTKMVILSGPTFAHEVALGLPTAITAASNQLDFAYQWASLLGGKRFRVYPSDDLVGVQICGAVKNVLAIAIGIADGMGFGANARCALITRGLVELKRLGKVFGGKDETFMGLAGIGDLVLTCTDNQSRNRRFGLAIGKGVTADVALQEIDQVVEGIVNAKIVLQLAKTHGIEMPIVEQVNKILFEGITPEAGVINLFNRALKSEINY
jgi:glycerol-3-phosphate dehydrogenase (NAD(P)+)